MSLGQDRDGGFTKRLNAACLDIALTALQSIANNACCSPCSEAKLVAQRALVSIGKLESS